MDHLQAVQARISTIKSLVESATPTNTGAAAFRAALDGALAERAVSGPAAAVSAANPGVAAGSMSFASLVPLLGGNAGVGAGALHAPVSAPVSSKFGPRVHPVTGVSHNHAGVDFAAPAGTPIQAAAAGTVTFAGWRGGYGNTVIVRHADGAETLYAHQRELSVRVGQQVDAGSVLGTVGSTGRSTGPHLHLEVRRDGVAVDPLPLLRRGGLPGSAHVHG